MADEETAPGSGRAPRRCVRWSKRMREEFLDHLAATCNLRGAARHIGVQTCSVYLQRRRDPAFAAAWGDALALGYEMLETQLVGHALAGDGETMLDNGDPALPPIDVELALRLLTTYRNATGKPRRGGYAPKVATREETALAIMKKLDKIEAQRRVVAEAEAANARLRAEHAA